MSLDLNKLPQPDAVLIQIGLKKLGFYNGTTRGLPGENTRSAYARYLQSREDRAAISEFPNLFTRIAESQLGVKEVGGNNRGAKIDEYETATWLDPKKDWAWCASFICWVVRETIRDIPVNFSRPRTAGAWDFERWAKTQKGRGVKLIKPAPSKILKGDIIVFTSSHIGMARRDSSGKYVQTIEGNTGDQGQRDGDVVASKRRHLSKIRSVIRIS